MTWNFWNKYGSLKYSDSILKDNPDSWWDFEIFTCNKVLKYLFSENSLSRREELCFETLGKTLVFSLFPWNHERYMFLEKYCLGHHTQNMERHWKTYKYRSSTFNMLLSKSETGNCCSDVYDGWQQTSVQKKALCTWKVNIYIYAHVP